MPLSAQPIQRSKSLYEQTYQALRASILSGELVGGDRLVETQLAEKLQVSRTPIREALRQIQQEGLIVAEPGGGLRVVSVSTEDVIHLYDCRLALEQVAVAGAIIHITAEQLKKLERLVIQAEKLMDEDTSRFKTSQRLDLDYQFHHLIAESSGNRWLVPLLDQVFDKMALLRIQTTQCNPKVLEIRLEHRQIYDAIAQKNRAIAVQAIQNHLTASRERVVQAVLNSEG